MFTPSFNLCYDGSTEHPNVVVVGSIPSSGSGFTASNPQFTIKIATGLTRPFGPDSSSTPWRLECFFDVTEGAHLVIGDKPWGFEFVSDPTAYFVDALPLSLNVTFALGSLGTVPLKEY